MIYNKRVWINLISLLQLDGKIVKGACVDFVVVGAYSVTVPLVSVDTLRGFDFRYSEDNSQVLRCSHHMTRQRPTTRCKSLP